MENGYVELESSIPTSGANCARRIRRAPDVGGYGGYQAIKVGMHNGQRARWRERSRKDSRPPVIKKHCCVTVTPLR